MSATFLACVVSWVSILCVDTWLAVDPILGNASGADTENLDVFTPSSASSTWSFGALLILIGAVGLAVGLWLFVQERHVSANLLRVSGFLSVLGQAVDGRQEALLTMAFFAAGVGLMLTSPVRDRIRRAPAASAPRSVAPPQEQKR